MEGEKEPVRDIETYEKAISVLQVRDNDSNDQKNNRDGGK